MNVLMEMSVLIMLDVPILLEVIDVIVTPDSDRKEDFVLVKKNMGQGVSMVSDLLWLSSLNKIGSPLFLKIFKTSQILVIIDKLKK